MVEGGFLLGLGRAKHANESSFISRNCSPPFRETSSMLDVIIEGYSALRLKLLNYIFFVIFPLWRALASFCCGSAGIASIVINVLGFPISFTYYESFDCFFKDYFKN